MMTAPKQIPFEVLLVEDNPGDVRLTKTALKEAGFEYNISVARDGSEAISFLKKNGNFKQVPSPNLIFLDLNLPKKNGLEVLREIKSDDDLKYIPVVMLSNLDPRRGITKDETTRADEYVRKPLDLDEYLEKIKSIGAQYHPSSQGETSSDQGELENVLIVDDDISILRLFKRILARAKCRVVATSSAKVALNELRHNKIAVIISDHEMPEMEGLELLQEAKRIAPDTIRIMVTGHDDTHLAIDAINLAAVHKFLLKPVDPAVYLESVDLALWLYEHSHHSGKKVEKSKVACLEMSQLASGMVLARPVITIKNKMLLPRNAELTSARITRLSQIHKIEPIEGKVYVYELSPSTLN